MPIVLTHHQMELWHKNDQDNVFFLVSAATYINLMTIGARPFVPRRFYSNDSRKADRFSDTNIQSSLIGIKYINVAWPSMYPV